MMLKELIKERLELWCKNRWVKMIVKEHRKLKKLMDATNRQKYVVQKLIDRYYEVYPDNAL